MKWPRLARTLAALMLGAAWPGTLHAQGPVPAPRNAAAPIAGDTAGSAAPGSRRLQPWIPRQPAVARTLVEITFINTTAAVVNSIARDITSPSPGTWWDNLQGGWEWDPNDIRVNHVEHPWAGAAYFNSARGNGLTFWGSGPMALAGSLMWELFGEAKPPSINDVLSTSLGGMALGEPLHRLSLIMLDEESSGVDRLWREFAVFLLNPGMGLNRLSQGDSWTRRQNPPGHRPDAMRGGLAFGARQFAGTDGSESRGTSLISLNVQYGDPFAARSQGPFSHFTGGMEIVGTSPDGLGSLNARGLLARFGSADGPGNHVGGVFMDLDYRRDGLVEFAQQSFGVGMLSRTRLHRGFRLDTDASVEAVPILAVGDAYSKPITRRRYDYGAGAGARLLARLEHRGRRVLSASGRLYWAPTIDGASETKLVQLATVDARLPLLWNLSLGASYDLYRQRSTYADRPTAVERLTSLSFFLSTGY